MRRLMNNLRRLYSTLGERGSIAVEMALIAPVFFLLILGIFELGYEVFVQTVLDGAARDAARLVRTGQVQSNGNPQAAFESQLCGDMSALVSCGSLIFSVQTFGTWSAVTLATPTPPKNGQMIFFPGSSGSIVAIQVAYTYPFLTTLIGQYLGGSTGSALLSSTVIFRNEPFPSS